MGGFFILSDSLTDALTDLGQTDDALDEAQSIAEQIVSDAKSNAPWEDRTGQAREGLEAEASQEGGDIVITLMHTVDHGQWLETIQSGRFAIIMPTLEKYAPMVHQLVAKEIFGG